MPPPHAPSAYQLLVAVLEHSPLFMYGFEAGMLWGHLQRKEPLIVATVHDENHEILDAMAEVQGYALDFLSSETPGWLIARFVYTEAEEE